MRKRTARILRHAADRLDPKPARWYQAGTQTGAFAQSYTNAGYVQVRPTMTHTLTGKPHRPRRRVLADYLSTIDLKKLRP